MEYCGEDKINGTVKFSEKQWESILFQIIFTLYVSQKMYKLNHNDLHLGNILFQKTNNEYLYYKCPRYSKIYYFKIPTFGYIVKIIDWNRATFTLGDTFFSNDCFDEDGMCDGQFRFTQKRYKQKPCILPNEHTDLALLASSILEENNIPKATAIYKLVKSWCTTKQNECIPEKYNGFTSYEKCSSCVNSNPSKLLWHSIFSKYTIAKSHISKEITIYSV
jgi:hypothetical protein